MDPFKDILSAMHCTGGIFLDAEFTAPWCVSSRIGPDDCKPFSPIPRSLIALHFVCAGRLMLEVDGLPPVALERGDIVALPRNDHHRLGSHLNLVPISADSLIQAGTDGRLAHIDYGGGGEMTRIVCGFLGTDRLHDPVLAMLPKVLKLRVEEGAAETWIESSFRFAAQETTVGLTQSPNVLTRLSEALFIDAVRRYLNALPIEMSGWCAGMRDTKIAHALSLLHGRMKHSWTTEELALQVGMSRSAFAERFTRVIGESPMRYLAQHRLLSASQRLKESSDSIARISFDVGYESEAAFNRAFKREFGAPPATWRKTQD